MATAARGKKPASKVGSSSSDYPIPPLPVVLATPAESLGESIMGWIAACVLVVLLLPLIGMLYMDVLQTKKEAQTQIEKMEKLRREVEKEKRDDSNSRIPPR